MDSVKKAIYLLLGSTSAITDVVGTRIYHQRLPQSPTYPALVYHLISDIAIEHTHDQYVGPRQARMQLDWYATSVPAVENLGEQIYRALAGWRGIVGDGASPETTWIVGGIFDEGANPDLSFQEEPTVRWIEGRSRDFMILYKY